MVVEVLLPFLFFLLLLDDLCFDLRVVELILLRDILVVSCNILLLLLLLFNVVLFFLLVVLVVDVGVAFDDNVVADVVFHACLDDNN